ncbi:MAG: hypothetical protein ABIH92_00715, partial [Nanoarchaeota archaeon]
MEYRMVFINLENVIRSIPSHKKLVTLDPGTLRVVPDTCVLNKVRRNGDFYNFITRNSNGTSYRFVILNEVFKEV